MNILCCLFCFNVVCRCYNWTLSSEICIRGDFLLTELFTSLCDTFQFWQILTDSEQLQSLLASAGTRTSFARTARSHCTQARAPGQLSRTYARQAAAFTRAGEIRTLETFWRREDCGETWLRGNLAASLMSQKNEKALRIICKIGLRNGERGEREGCGG